MATFECKVYELTIEEHPNADAIELARVGDYRSIVRKGEFKTGDLGVYIPEGAIVPEQLLERLGLVGKLAGSKHNRVKAVRLRGIVSQGLIVPIEFREHVMDQDTHEFSDVYVLSMRGEAGAGHIVEEGDDVMEWLGVTKWEPPIPTQMAGEVFAAFGKTISYDIENIKRFPDIFEDGEHISITEKIHGTWCCMGYHPAIDGPVVTSKGLSGKGLAFKFNEANVNNLYVRAYEATVDEKTNIGILDRLIEALDIDMEETPFYILGEIFGAGIQDLTYGGDKPQFRVFDIYIGAPQNGSYLDPEEMRQVVAKLGVSQVPILYAGPYDKQIVEDYTNGKETISGGDNHMREGVVVKPMEGRRHPELGRVFLKSVSDDYLLRRNATEHN